MTRFLVNYDIEIGYHPSKANVDIDALNKSPVMCGAKLVAMGIRYEDQQEDVVDRQLVAVMARLTISLSIVDPIR